MKKKILSLFVALIMLFTLSGCGDVKNIGGVTYDTYGFLNKSDKKNPDIEYRLIIGNIVWSVILFETIIAPLYFIGFSIYEPVGIKDKTLPKGAIINPR